MLRVREKRAITSTDPPNSSKNASTEVSMFTTPTRGAHTRSATRSAGPSHLSTGPSFTPSPARRNDERLGKRRELRLMVGRPEASVEAMAMGGVLGEVTASGGGTGTGAVSRASSSEENMLLRPLPLATGVTGGGGGPGGGGGERGWPGGGGGGIARSETTSR